MKNTQVNLLDEFSGEKLQPIRRRKLLPMWIKIFIWIFIVFAVATVPVSIMGFTGNNVNLSLYGLEGTDLNSTEGRLILFLFFYKGLVAFLLWFEQKVAVTLGIFDAILGILICLWVMFVAHSVNFRLELVLLIPYLYKLIKIRKSWEDWIVNP
jgi:hypothetical protein